MTKQLKFSYRSIGNFSKLLSTILYEKEHTPKEITLWHQRFDSDEGDDLFEGFLEELFPEGGKLEENELILLMNRAERFLLKDPIAIEQRAAYEKREYKSWVYFKVDKKVYPCGYAKHQATVRAVCMDYFKDVDEVDVDYVRKFILENFEICSDNSTIDKIANDSLYIYHSIIFQDHRRVRNHE